MTDLDPLPMAVRMAADPTTDPCGCLRGEQGIAMPCERHLRQVLDLELDEGIRAAGEHAQYVTKRSRA